MSFSGEEVRHLSTLTRLGLTEEETEQFAGQLNRVLAAVESLQSIPVDDVPPTVHLLPLQNVMRDDEVWESLPREQALSQASEQDGVFFLVPKVVDAGGDDA